MIRLESADADHGVSCIDLLSKLAFLLAGLQPFHTEISDA